MDKQRQKTVNRTFSIPVDVSKDLHAYVKQREMSRFVTEAIRKELLSRKAELRKHYSEAEKDPGQVEARNEWDSTAADGFDEW